jgi:hypothetical protein
VGSLPLSRPTENPYLRDPGVRGLGAASVLAARPRAHRAYGAAGTVDQVRRCRRFPVSRSSPQPGRAGLRWPSNRRRCLTQRRPSMPSATDIGWPISRNGWRADGAAAPQVRQADQLSGHLGGSQGQIGSSRNWYAKFTSGQHLASKHIIQALARPPDGVPHGLTVLRPREITLGS